MVKKNYKFSNGKADIERLIRKKPQFADALEKAKREAKSLYEGFFDDVSWVSGWGHNFCCPDCAAQMIFDINMKYNAPNTFTCPNCGKKASGIDFDEAWVYYYRHTYGDKLNNCSVAAMFGDEKALKFIIRYVDFYAENYDKFEVHGKHAGKGKIMEQALDEAVWTISVISALKAVDDMIPEEKKQQWYKKLFLPITELILPQSNSIHNIPTWLKCAVGVIGIYFGDDSLLDVSLNSEFGIRNQISKGFTEDGIWYEGSMGYHFYTASALSGFFAFYAEKCPTDSIFETYAKIYTSPMLLSHDGRRLPALNDGWYSKKSVMSVNLTANRICDDKSFLDANRVIFETDPKQGVHTNGLLYMTVEDDVTVLSATRLAVIKKPFHVLLKSGVISQSHMHHDCLSVIIAPFSDDLGTPGYGHELSKKYYRFIAAHNTVAVDLTHPAGVPGTTMEKVDGGARAAVIPGTWSDLTLAERTLTVDGDSVCDITELKAPTEHTYDWIFHSIGNAEYSCEAGEIVDSLGDTMGYSYIEQIRKMRTDGAFSATFTIENGEALTLTIPSTEGIEVYTAKTPDNPADNKRNTVILRTRAKEATFRAVFTKN